MGINLSKTRNMKYVVERAGLSWDEANKIIGNKDCMRLSEQKDHLRRRIVSA